MKYILFLFAIVATLFAHKITFNNSTIDCPLIIDKETKTDEFNIKMRREIRDNVMKKMIEKIGNDNGVIVLVGEKSYMNRQLSEFMYLTGANYESSFHMTLDLKTKDYYLFVPKIDKQQAIWEQPVIPTLEDYQKKYAATKVYYNDKLNEVLEMYFQMGRVFYTMPDDSILKPNYPRNNQILLPTLRRLRAIKTEMELKVMQIAADVTSKAHTEMMLQSRSGIYEYQLQSLMEYICKKCGLIEQAFYPIVGSGRRGAALHYQRNSEIIEKGDLVLIDAGGDYMHYAADITRTFPADGKFTEDQKMIYNIVLAAQMNAISAIRPGVSWHNVSKIASMTILNGLLKNGFIKGDLNTLYENKIHQLFMPHSLGHHMGLDVHDAADFETPENILEPNMVITVEPGIYFIGILFDEAEEPIKKFLVMDKINKFKKFGGIRIEDDVLVTKDGFKVITNVVKTVEGIEKLMQRRK